MKVVDRGLEESIPGEHCRLSDSSIISPSDPLDCFRVQVVQVYLSWTKSSVAVPRWTLVGFERVTLAVNSPVKLNFVITGEQMAVWFDDKTGYSIQPGIRLSSFAEEYIRML